MPPLCDYPQSSNSRRASLCQHFLYRLGLCRDLQTALRSSYVRKRSGFDWGFRSRA
ncbi:hypothetical protein NXT3_PA00277 (plasmid) [Sinorhizobium fredii]|uniref:Uncharacterized protein n=1 Tax=Rhizobium fredii TaxID=380 RepID=A0A2L0HAQ1_RHIFR|nr:hypothetical protein NXT3_PA00277 [Sinorhizobium fredii]